MPRRRNIAAWPVMPAKCSTCPFNENGDIELRNAIMSRTVLKGSQICHHPKTVGKKKETHLCRGSRDQQLIILHRLGFIPEPTDGAFKSASEFYLQKGNHNAKEKTKWRD